MSKTTVIQLYKEGNEEGIEFCFNIQCTRELDADERQNLELTLADGFIAETISATSCLSGERVVEVGPRLNFATAWSSNMVSICQAIGLGGIITRVERSRRYVVPEGEDINAFVAAHHDRMTECFYPKSLDSFVETGITPEAVYEVLLKEHGPNELLGIPGISMDEWDRNFYYDYFVTKHNRNPTIVEIMDLNNANSEHSRHGFFNAKQIIDGVPQEENLMEIVKSTLAANPGNSKIAFKDNSSVIEGCSVQVLIPSCPGEPSALVMKMATYHPLFTAETHNFPTGVAPFPGAETGTGGRIRDVQGTGKGGFIGAGTTGYCVGNLHIPGYVLSWEEHYPCPDNLATALQIEIKASNGASDYGNKFGEPMIQGFTRSFDLRLADSERWGFLKPIMFTAGVGQMDNCLIRKDAARKGMIITQVGGPAYRVGFGGGAASSMLQGENKANLDFNAVQRGDAEMEQKMNRVIRACNEMGDQTLIDVIHDQGAGGPANVLKELVEKAGGRINIRKIRVGDPTMSVLEIYVAEYQERNGFLISPHNLEQFQAICTREKVNCEVLGEVTGDLRFVVVDEEDGSTPVDLELDVVLGGMPPKTFSDHRRKKMLSPVVLPEGLTIRQALNDVLRLLSVGSKRFLTNKVDRAVSGLIVRQQCCGPLQTPLSDVAVVAQSYFSLSGIATAIGEQPIKLIADPEAGARMSVGEAITNLIWARIKGGLKEVKCSANWMWAPKLPGEGAALHDAACAMRGAMMATGVAVDGGKDSLSMATLVGEETVKSPRELVISLYALMNDCNVSVGPDIKDPGNSVLIFVDLGGGKNRLGGSALAQVLKQIGSEPADLDDPALLVRAFDVIQSLLDQDLILAGHDRSDGGLITTLLEMAFSGNCGLEVELFGQSPVINQFFGEELGLVFEVSDGKQQFVLQKLAEQGVPASVIAKTREFKVVHVRYNGEVVLDEDMQVLRGLWEETSFQLEKLQMNPICAQAENTALYARQGPTYIVPFNPQPTSQSILTKTGKSRVAILRDEGSNSDREMSAAFYAAGFEPWDITMMDLLFGRITLDRFRGLAAVGGFSYADVPESAKGWAATIKFNQRLARMFGAFLDRPDTFTLGICNGCQLFGLLGWVPWQGIDPAKQPRFIHNISRRFESRWSTVEILPSPAMMLQGIEGLQFGIHVDHGEGLLSFPDQDIRQQVLEQNLAPICFVDDQGQPTEGYPFNPNGSPDGLTGLCTPDGRHLAMMPHPERVFDKRQAHWMPESMRKSLPASPWLQMFQNAYAWCQE
ncbi:MAG: phosphoribosylformylglycinamidine synthase [Parcubacteria group bacterium]|jgi:phosphoribosylformylglycinamidine synthase